MGFIRGTETSDMPGNLIPYDLLGLGVGLLDLIPEKCSTDEDLP